MPGKYQHMGKNSTICTCCIYGWWDTRACRTFLGCNGWLNSLLVGFEEVLQWSRSLSNTRHHRPLFFIDNQTGSMKAHRPGIFPGHISQPDGKRLWGKFSRDCAYLDRQLDAKSSQKKTVHFLGWGVRFSWLRDRWRGDHGCGKTSKCLFTGMQLHRTSWAWA